MNICRNDDCPIEISDDRKYCSLKCRNVYVNKHLRNYSKNVDGITRLREHKEIEYKKNPKKCLNCGIDIPFEKRSNKFCNHSCTASYTNVRRNIKFYTLSNIGLNNILIANQKKKEENTSKYLKNPNFCEMCDKELEYEKRNKKTCSKKCYKKLISRNNKSNSNCGGETNYKKFKYKDVWMDSSWEVKLAKWMDKNKIKWVRDKKIWFEWVDENSEKHRYHPDFYLPEFDMYIDPKNNYLIERDRLKLEYVKKHYNLNLLYGKVENITQEIENFL